MLSNDHPKTKTEKRILSLMVLDSFLGLPLKIVSNEVQFFTFKMSVEPFRNDWCCIKVY